jgi:hypothetical protein
VSIKALIAIALEANYSSSYSSKRGSVQAMLRSMISVVAKGGRKGSNWENLIRLLGSTADTLVASVRRQVRSSVNIRASFK